MAPHTFSDPLWMHAFDEHRNAFDSQEQSDRQTMSPATEHAELAISIDANADFVGPAYSEFCLCAIAAIRYIFVNANQIGKVMIDFLHRPEASRQGQVVLSNFRDEILILDCVFRSGAFSEELDDTRQGYEGPHTAIPVAFRNETARDIARDMLSSALPPTTKVAPHSVRI